MKQYMHLILLACLLWHTEAAFAQNYRTSTNVVLPNLPPPGLPDHAQQTNSDAVPTTTPARGFVEVGGNFSSVTNNQGNWSGQHLRGEVQTDPSNRWNGTIQRQRKFRENGTYLSVGNVHQFNEDYYSDVTLGAGEGVFMPQFRADAFLNRKWLERRNLITTVGLGWNDSRNGYSDYSGFLGASYYFDAPWIIQGGVRFNNSRPGNVTSTSSFLALTYGRQNDYFLTLRYGFGKEAYQVIGEGNTLVDFRSDIVSLNWKQWVQTGTATEKGWGFDMTGEYYDNPTYSRTGIILGVFREF